MVERKLTQARLYAITGAGLFVLGRLIDWDDPGFDFAAMIMFVLALSARQEDYVDQAVRRLREDISSPPKVRTTIRDNTVSSLGVKKYGETWMLPLLGEMERIGRRLRLEFNAMCAGVSNAQAQEELSLRLGKLHTDLERARVDLESLIQASQNADRNAD